jgi:polysaccharide pyruvyl transferase WcaK-like protein
MKVLILNSDSPHNRGDRAILQGLVALIRDTIPAAEITALSQFQDRDQAWFGIRFLPFSPYSVSLIHYLSLLREAARSDLVLWGGGELLKDYTNKLSLFYWLLKIWGVRRVNRNLIGAFQGIGPTSGRLSRRVIVATVNHCREFLVRDGESAEKLTGWGARTKIRSSFDPAVYLSAETIATTAKPKRSEHQPIGFGLRRWFHYQPGGWLPRRFRIAAFSGNAQTAAERTYLKHSAELADSLIEEFDAPLVFFPMHLGPGEDDAGFAREVIARMRHGDRTRILAADDCSPSEYLARIADCRVFVASRLHSAILATVAQVPTICLYYVDKGRVFFEQLGLERYSRPIAELLERDAAQELAKLALVADKQAAKIRKTQSAALAQMRQQLRADFAAAVVADA